MSSSDHEQASMLGAMVGIATREELTCPICKKFGCKHDQQAKATPLEQLCPVCKRNKVVCICTSHTPMFPGTTARNESGEPPCGKTVDAVVQEGMHYYYNTRDAVALEKLLRRLAIAAQVGRT